MIWIYHYALSEDDEEDNNDNVNQKKSRAPLSGKDDIFYRIKKKNQN